MIILFKRSDFELKVTDILDQRSDFKQETIFCGGKKTNEKHLNSRRKKDAFHST